VLFQKGVPLPKFAVQVDHVCKSYAHNIAVNDLTFYVNQGETFGLIGPNGAGKTTSIRMMMDIIKPDSGDVLILGERPGESSKNRLGYLPEERGLYRKLSVIDSIVYLASLKGVAKAEAGKRAEQLLRRTGMLPQARRRIEELSKGMGQIIQFIVTVVHDPELVILDEPFSGLDPVNTELLKTLIIELKDQGKAVVLSTHQMNQVEELCDRVLMINDGRAVLYGSLNEIKTRYKSNSVIVELQGEPGLIPGVIERRVHKNELELVLDGNTGPGQVLERLVRAGVTINRFEVSTPSLNEIFLRVAGVGRG
jgi:ABC-2 type transport system ATP-binding protein